jgi:alanyl-tRNA synthetase
LTQLYGPFPEYKSFGDIIRIEYERWTSTEDSQKKKIEQLVAKKKGKLTLDDWITGIQAWGIPADVIAQVSKTEVPGNLYNEIARRAEKIAKAQDAILYDTISYPETENLYYQNHLLYQFDAKVVGILTNVQ